MTEIDKDAATREILSFANQCGSEGRDAEDIARRRGWLDEAGVPTKEGLDLVRELDGQERTPTVFRIVP